MGITSSQVEPQTPNIMFKASSLESFPAPAIRRVKTRGKPARAPPMALRTALKQLVRTGPEDDDFDASQQLTAESEAGVMAGTGTGTGTAVSRDNNVSSSVQHEKKEEKNEKKKMKRKKKNAKTSAIHLHPATHLPLPATSFDAPVREMTPIIHSSPPSLHPLDCTFDGWPESPSRTQMTAVPDSQPEAYIAVANHAPPRHEREDEAIGARQPTSSHLKKRKRKLDPEFTQHDGATEAALGGANVTKKAKRAKKFKSSTNHSTEDVVVPTSLLVGLKARRQAEVQKESRPLIADNSSRSPEQHATPSSNDELPSSTKSKSKKSPESFNPDPIALLSQELPPSNQEIPSSHGDVHRSSKKNSKNSRKPIISQEPAEETLLVEEAASVQSQASSSSQRSNGLVGPDPVPSYQTEGSSHLQQVEVSPTQDRTQVEEPTEVEAQASTDVKPAATTTGDSNRTNSSGKKRKRASEVHGLIGAEKELNTVRVLSNPPELRNEGLWSEDEQEIIRRAIADYQTTHRLDLQGLISVIQYIREYQNKSSDSRNGHEARAREIDGLFDTTADFWKTICEHLPHRNKVAIRKTIRAKYHGYKGGGGWEHDEDQELKALYAQFPGQWTKISQQLGNRDAGSCALRWKNYVQHGEYRNTQRWSLEEEDRLRQAVRDATDQSRQEIDWSAVVANMETRSRIQITQKFKQMQKCDKAGTSSTKHKRAKKKNPRQSEPAAEETVESKVNLVLPSTEIRHDTIVAEKMLSGDKIDLMWSILRDGPPVSLEDIDWDGVSAALEGSLGTVRWSPKACEDAFITLLETVEEKGGDFRTALVTLQDLMNQISDVEGAERYTLTEDEHDNDL